MVVRIRLYISILLAGLLFLNAAYYLQIKSVQDTISGLPDIQKKLSSLESDVEQIRSDVKALKQQTRPPLIVLRIDDIHDFYQTEAQLFLLRYNIERKIPMSLAIIPKFFGADKDLVKVVSSAVQQGSEITVQAGITRNFPKPPWSSRKKCCGMPRKN